MPKVWCHGDLGLPRAGEHLLNRDAKILLTRFFSLGTTFVKATCGCDLLHHQATNNMEPQQCIPTTERGAKPGVAGGAPRVSRGSEGRATFKRTRARMWSKDQGVFVSYTFTKNSIGWLKAVEGRDNETSTVATIATRRSRQHRWRDNSIQVNSRGRYDSEYRVFTML